MTLSEKIDKFFDLEQEIHAAFGYVEDWVDIAMEDHRQNYWQLFENEHGGGEVVFHEEPLTKEKIRDGAHYSYTIYTQRFLPKWIYRTEELTMICSATGVDGNKFLAIFDNAKEQTSETTGMQ